MLVCDVCATYLYKFYVYVCVLVCDVCTYVLFVCVCTVCMYVSLVYVLYVHCLCAEYVCCVCTYNTVCVCVCVHGVNGEVCCSVCGVYGGVYYVFVTRHTPLMFSLSMFSGFRSSKQEKLTDDQALNQLQ